MTDSPEENVTIIDLAKKGRRPQEIQKEMGGRIPLEKIYRVLHGARKAGTAVPNFREDQGDNLISDKVRTLLAPHAERREITVNILARRILGVVAQENMVDAVLDDGTK